MKNQSLSYTQAMEAVRSGEKIALPEWNGSYWFMFDGKLSEFTESGSIQAVRDQKRHVHRLNWKVLDEEDLASINKRLNYQIEGNLEVVGNAIDEGDLPVEPHVDSENETESIHPAENKSDEAEDPVKQTKPSTRKRSSSGGKKK